MSERLDRIERILASAAQMAQANASSIAELKKVQEQNTAQIAELRADHEELRTDHEFVRTWLGEMARITADIGRGTIANTASIDRLDDILTRWLTEYRNGNGNGHGEN